MPMTMSNRMIDRIVLSCLVVLRSMITEWIEVGIRARVRLC